MKPFAPRKENGPAPGLGARRLPLADITNDGAELLRRALAAPASASAAPRARGAAKLKAARSAVSENVLADEPPPARPQAFQAPASSKDGARAPWSAAQVPPKTHKLASGQLVVLPSRAVLLDLREGERRRGRAGAEVLLVSADGRTVQVFSAPHLSSPCCLAEPCATYSLEELPAAHYKLYEQARRVLDRIKRRIPKLVLYEADATCTLMSNGPQADITVALDAPSPSPPAAAPAPSVRIVLSRALLTAEISTACGGDATRRVLFWRGQAEGVGRDEARRLGAGERRALDALMRFLPVAEKAEAEAAGDGADGPRIVDRRPAGAGAGTPAAPRRKKKAAPVPDAAPAAAVPFPSASAALSPAASNLTSASTSLSELSVSPRPKLASLGLGPSPAKTAAPTTRKASSTAVARSPSTFDAAFASPASKVTEPPALEALETRFLAGAGWCVRAGRTYRLMFLDGAILEVGVDDERVVFVGAEGAVVRCAVRACYKHAEVGARMGAFERFVEMFEGAEEGAE